MNSLPNFTSFSCDHHCPRMAADNMMKLTVLLAVWAKRGGRLPIAALVKNRGPSGLFLAAVLHSCDSSVWALAQFEGEGGGLRPHFTGSAAPGAHGETLSRSLIVPYRPLRLSANCSLLSSVRPLESLFALFT